MKKRYTEEQVIGFLREADAGLSVQELCRRHGFSEASYYHWYAPMRQMKSGRWILCLTAVLKAG
jgi:putative transposase